MAFCHYGFHFLSNNLHFILGLGYVEICLLKVVCCADLTSLIITTFNLDNQNGLLLSKMYILFIHPHVIPTLWLSYTVSVKRHLWHMPSFNRHKHKCILRGWDFTEQQLQFWSVHHTNLSYSYMDFYEAFDRINHYTLPLCGKQQVCFVLHGRKNVSNDMRVSKWMSFLSKLFL